jgi:hypothetical protein
MRPLCPLYRNFLELTGSRGTTGEFGPVRRVVSSALYYLFLLNSSKRGDEIFVLAERAGGIFETNEMYEKHCSTDRA